MTDLLEIKLQDYIDKRIAALEDQRWPLPAEARHRINELRLLRERIQQIKEGKA